MLGFQLLKLGQQLVELLVGHFGNIELVVLVVQVVQALGEGLNALLNGE